MHQKKLKWSVNQFQDGRTLENFHEMTLLTLLTRGEDNKREVEENVRWLNQLSICSCAAIDADARTFIKTIWASPKSTILSSRIAAEQLRKLCCGCWLSCDMIESVFEMLNQMGPAHQFVVCSEAVIDSVSAK